MQPLALPAFLKAVSQDPALLGQPQQHPVIMVRQHDKYYKSRQAAHVAVTAAVEGTQNPSFVQLWVLRMPAPMLLHAWLRSNAVLAMRALAPGLTETLACRRCGTRTRW